MDWFLYDNGLRHERVNHVCGTSQGIVGMAFGEMTLAKHEIIQSQVMERINLIFKILGCILAVVSLLSGGTVSATMRFCTLTWKV